MLWILKSRVFIEYYSYYKYGSIMDSISQEQFKDFNFYCPPTIEEQDLIVNFLKPKCTEIDNLIAKKENLLADLEAYKKSLIYECVTGKREVV
jgi:type I restriction enzyme S subunit